MELKWFKSKKLPPMGIEPGVLELWQPLFLKSHAFLNELTWQVLIEGHFISLFLHQIDFWTKMI